MEIKISENIFKFDFVNFGVHKRYKILFIFLGENSITNYTRSSQISIDNLIY
jgi:hypothetical protein